MKNKARRNTRITVKYSPSTHKIKVKTWFDAFMEADFIIATHPDRSLAMKIWRAQQ